MARTRYPSEDWERLCREAELDGSHDAMLRLLREATRLERPVLRDTPTLWNAVIPPLELDRWDDLALLVAYARAARDLDAQRAIWSALLPAKPRLQDGETHVTLEDALYDIHAFSGEPLSLERPTPLPLLWDTGRARRFLEPRLERWTERLTEHCPDTDVFLEAFFAYSEACGDGTGRRKALKHAHSQAKRGLALVRSRIRQRRDAFYGLAHDSDTPELGNADAAEDWARAFVEATHNDILTRFTRVLGYGIRADLEVGIATPLTPLAHDILRTMLGFLPDVLVPIEEEAGAEHTTHCV